MSMYLDFEVQIENSFTKIDQKVLFVKRANILIATDSNSLSKTRHDNMKIRRGKKIEGIHGKQTSFRINEQSKNFTFLNSRV